MLSQLASVRIEKTPPQLQSTIGVILPYFRAAVAAAAAAAAACLDKKYRSLRTSLMRLQANLVYD